MSFQQKEMTGALFKNDKQGKESRPDYRGSATIKGVQYELAGWIKEGKNGKFMSLSVKDKEARREQVAPPRDEPPAENFDDSLPF